MTLALTASAQASPRPNPGIEPAYSATATDTPIDLWLAGNEGRSPAGLTFDSSGLARYPDPRPLTKRLATRFGVAPDQVLVTAGADDALLRIALAYLAEGREILLPSPTFEMIPRYARLAGGEIVEVEWSDASPFPLDAVLAATTERTSVIAVVSPNNPTGAVATAQDLERLCLAAPHALVVFDGAYAEFADEDLTRVALEHPNAVTLRTFSKAYGCAGLRVGYALGGAEVMATLRAAGNPYPCSTPSLRAAEARLDQNVLPLVESVRTERIELRQTLEELGVESQPSQANFVLARDPRAPQIAELLQGFGIAVRAWTDRPGMENALRITCPAHQGDQSRLQAALATVLRPEALIFDMDGVLADVSRSYRAAIVETARTYAIRIADRDIDAAKARGGANDDWDLTRRLLAERGVEASLAEVTERFEALYQGTAERPGLRATETLLIPEPTLGRWAATLPLGIVTGRPSADAERFLNEHDIGQHFRVLVAREDAPLKPDPAPTALALSRLGVRRAWLFGDTPDDVVSARAAGALPVGVLAPSASAERDGEAAARSLRRAGAGAVLPNARSLIERVETFVMPLGGRP